MFRLGVLEVMRAKADAASLAFVRKAAGHEAISTRLYAYRALVFKSKDGTAPLLAAADAEEFMAERLKVEPAPVRANMLRGLGVSGLSSEGVDRIAVSQLKDVDVGVRFHSLNLLIRNSKLKPVLRDPDIRQPAAVWDPYADKIVAWVGDGAKAEDVPVFPQTAAAKGAVEGATKKLADGAAKTMSGAMRAAEGAMKSTASRPVGGPGK